MFGKKIVIIDASFDLKGWGEARHETVVLKDFLRTIAGKKAIVIHGCISKDLVEALNAYSCTVLLAADFDTVKESLDHGDKIYLPHHDSLCTLL